MNPDNIKDPAKFIKVPNTAILDNRGFLAQAWVYFFNSVGEAIDAQVAANLPELTQQLLDTVEKTILLKQATEDNELATSIANESIVANIEAIRVNADAIEANQADIADLDSRVTTNTGKIATNEGAIAGHKTAISSLQTQVGELQAQLAALHTELEGLRGTAQTNTDNITALDTRVTTLEQA